MWHQDNDAHDKAVDSLTNFETVKYFTNEDYELRRYRESVALYQKHMFSTSVCARWGHVKRRFHSHSSAMCLCSGRCIRSTLCSSSL